MDAISGRGEIQSRPLYELIGELGETHSCCAFQSFFNTILRHHIVHGDVLTDIPDEIKKVYLTEPVVIIDYNCCIRRRVIKIKKSLQLPANARQIVV